MGADLRGEKKRGGGPARGREKHFRRRRRRGRKRRRALGRLAQGRAGIAVLPIRSKITDPFQGSNGRGRRQIEAGAVVEV